MVLTGLRFGSPRRLCTVLLRGFLVLCALAMCIGCARSLTAADIQEHGTRRFAGHAQREVTGASIAALRTLGFDVAVADQNGGHVKSAPKLLQVYAVGGPYSATALRDELAWSIDVSSAPDGVLVYARPRAFRNGQAMDDSEMNADYMERAFADLFREIESNLSGGKSRLEAREADSAKPKETEAKPAGAEKKHKDAKQLKR